MWRRESQVLRMVKLELLGLRRESEREGPETKS